MNRPSARVLGGRGQAGVEPYGELLPRSDASFMLRFATIAARIALS
ncbi:hypothetical protein [Lysobacter sp. D1-1-M9]